MCYCIQMRLSPLMLRHHILGIRDSFHNITLCFQGGNCPPIPALLVSVCPRNVPSFLWLSVGPSVRRSVGRLVVHRFVLYVQWSVFRAVHVVPALAVASLLRSAASALVDYAFCQCLYGPPTSPYRPTG